MKKFSENSITQRRLRAQQALDKVLKKNESVVVSSGLPLTQPGGLDQTYDFLPHPNYYWITGLRRPKGITTYSPSEGWTDFVDPVGPEEKIWEGGSEGPEGTDVKHFRKWLGKRDKKSVVTLNDLSQDIEIYIDKAKKEKKQLEILETWNSCRRIKDSEEISKIKLAAQAASKGYELLRKMNFEGKSERAIQIEYEAETFRHGSQKAPYGTIVGAGTNSAILHAHPSSRIVKKDDIVLIDAGADIDDYCVDITRVFNSSGKFTKQQQAIFDIVHAAQTASIELCRAGIQWKDVHIASAKEIAKGLKDLKILNCSVEDAVSTHAVSAFFPHGVGHMVGLKVRDVGGDVTKKTKKYVGVNLRVDLELQENFVMTVEPGLYFIPTLLETYKNNDKLKGFFNWNEIEKWTSFGGVRLEDDILVKKNSNENLTGFIPKV